MTLPLIILTLAAVLVVCLVVSWLSGNSATSAGTATMEDTNDWIHWRDALDRTARSTHWVAPGELAAEDYEGDEEVTEPMPRVVEAECEPAPDRERSALVSA